MFCKWCGEELRNPGEFCQKCGHEAPALSDCGGFYNLVPEEAPKTKPTASIEYANKVTAAAAAPASRLPADTTVSKPQRSDLPPRALPIEQKQKKKKPVWQRILPIALALLAFIILFSQNLAVKRNLKSTTSTLETLTKQFEEFETESYDRSIGRIQNDASTEYIESEASAETMVSSEPAEPEAPKEEAGIVEEPTTHYLFTLDSSGYCTKDLDIVEDDEGQKWHSFSKETLDFDIPEPDGKNIRAALNLDVIDEKYILKMDCSLIGYGDIDHREFCWEYQNPDNQLWKVEQMSEDDPSVFEFDKYNEEFQERTINVRCTITYFMTDGEQIVLRIGDQALPIYAPYESYTDVEDDENSWE